jgi:hypothetical protein
MSSEAGGGPARCGAGPPSRISRPVSRVLCGAGRSPTRDGHSSGTPVARRFERPTRTAGSRHRSWNAGAAGATLALHTVPIRFCSRWGLPCRLRCRKRGALLPHRFTLTAAPPPYPPPQAGEGKGWGPGRGGLFSVALSLGSPPPDVIRHRMSMEPGLSSPAPSLPLSFTRRVGRGTEAAVRPTDDSRNGGRRAWRQGPALTPKNPNACPGTAE